MSLVDAHIHLTDDDYSSILTPIIIILRSLKIIAVSVSMDLNTATKNLSLASSFKDVIVPFVGIHPWSAGENLTAFSDFVSNHEGKISGIGEIGLDRKYVADNIDGYNRQKEVFENMLEVAEKMEKPTSIHSRGSLDDVLDLLPSYRLKANLLHWFAGSKKQLKRATDMGNYVSYGPVLVYSEEKRSLLKDTPLNRILVETDGPVQYSSCFEGRAALPSFLPSVVFAVATTLHVSYDEACGLLMNNSQHYLDHSFQKQ